MNQNDFMRQQQAAVERMREMSAKAVRSDNRPMPPVPPFVKLQGRTEPAPAPEPEPRPIPEPLSRPHREAGPLIPKLLESFKTDGDLPLILGLLLLLIGEGADKKLLFALIYILL